MIAIFHAEMHTSSYRLRFIVNSLKHNHYDGLHTYPFVGDDSNQRVDNIFHQNMIIRNLPLGNGSL